MKRISSVIACVAAISFAGYIPESFAELTTSSISVAAPVIGSSAGEGAGNISFDYEVGVPGAHEVSVNGQTGVFSGLFWSENVGWCSFNDLGANTAKLTGTNNDMPIEGYAWCENAGWILFNSTGSIPTDAYLTKSDGKFHGYAWSPNLWWIGLEGLFTDITPPDATNFKPFATEDTKTLVMSGENPTAPIGGSYIFEVDDWNDATTRYKTKYMSATSSFSHDFRKAKDDYHFRVTDAFGNMSEGILNVVANIPSDSLNAAKNISPSATATQYSSTFPNSVVADASANHVMAMNLRDQYGNPVITVPGIKTVTTRVTFKNTVDRDQVFASAGIFGDAIQFPWNTFAGLSYFSPNGYDSSAATGDYSLNIASYAPTKAGYPYTNSDDIALTKLSYQVEALSGFAGVGEVAETAKSDKVGTQNIKFAPALSVQTVTNADNWAIRTGYATNFSAKLLNSTSVALADVQVRNLLDIDLNNLVSYQVPLLQSSSGNEVCAAYNKTLATFSPPQYTKEGSSPTSCFNIQQSSELLVSPFNSNGSIDFSWKPVIIYAAPRANNIEYSSEVLYKNNGVAVKYPSYARSSNSSVLADGASVETASWVINQAVKIIGISSGKSNLDVLEWNSSSKVGSLIRTDIKNLIHKNVAILTRGGVPDGVNYVVKNGNYTLSTWPNGKDTIIVQGGDLIISEDIPRDDNKMKGIIVLKDDQWNGGNIYVKNSVKNIAAVLFADNGMISGSGLGVFYSDSKSATGQLFLQGSIISNNTIGGASMTPLACPSGIASCTDDIAKRYDLNYFRFYDGISAAAGVPDAGKEYPFVIYYDSRLQASPPPGFVVSE